MRFPRRVDIAVLIGNSNGMTFWGIAFSGRPEELGQFADKKAERCTVCRADGPECFHAACHAHSPGMK